MMNINRKIKSLLFNWKNFILISGLCVFASLCFGTIGNHLLSKMASYGKSKNLIMIRFSIYFIVSWFTGDIAFALGKLCENIYKTSNQKKLDKILLDKLSHVSPDVFHSSGVSDFRSQYGNIDKSFHDLFHNLFSHIIPSIIFLLISVSYVIYKNYYLGMITIGWILLMLLTLFITNKRQMELTNQYLKERMQYKKIQMESVNKFFIFFLFGKEEFLRQKNIQASLASATSSWKSRFFCWFRLRIVDIILFTLSCFTVVSVGTYLVIHGHMMIEDFMFFMNNQLWIIFKMLGIFRSLNRIIESWRKLEFACNFFDNLKPRKTGKQTIKEIHSVEFIGFGYVANNKVLYKNFNARFERGMRIAVVGKSGAGKSSLFRIFTTHNYTGKVIINDHIELKEINTNDLRNCISYVMQYNGLINGTIKENILFGGDYDRDKFKKIMNTIDPEGQLKDENGTYNREVGHEGSNISGGQEQKIKFIRMLMHNNKSMCILDEPRSGLDEKNKNSSEQLLHKYYDKSSTMFITSTHDLDYAKTYDYILKSEGNGEWRFDKAGNFGKIIL